MQLNIDSSKSVVFADKLERMSKRALPRAVKETLSKAALHTKQETMPKSTEKEFTIRRKNFFKANSSVEFAKMGSINSMRSTVGFIESKLVGSENHAVKDLEQQEYGGRIKGRKFIPMDTARVGKSREKLVKRSVPKLKELKDLGVIWAGDKKKNFTRKRAKTKKQRWVRAAFRAGVGGFVAGNRKRGRVTVRRIESISSNISTRALEIKSTPVYSFKKGGIKPVKSRGFMRRASLDTGTIMDDLFINEARKQIEYLMNR